MGRLCHGGCVLEVQHGANALAHGESMVHGTSSDVINGYTTHRVDGDLLCVILWLGAAERLTQILTHPRRMVGLTRELHRTLQS